MKTWLFVKTLLLAGLVAHFSIVGMDLMPDNPLKHQYKYEISNYMSPFFSQTWNLFAPTPINKNSTILVKYYLHKKDQTVDSTMWNDIVEPLIEQRRKSFWSPVQRVIKSMTSISSGYIESSNKALQIVAKTDSLKNEPEKAARFIKKALETTREHRMLMQYCNFVYFNQYAPAYDPSALDSVTVSFNFLAKEFPRFSQRHLDYYDEENYKILELKSEPYKLLDYVK